MQLIFGIIVLGGFAISGLSAQPGMEHHPGTVMCLKCDNIKDPRACNNVARCHHEEQCYTEVNNINGETVYTMGCKPRHECDRLSMPVGRRMVTSPCQQCCHGLACNRDLCGSYLPTTPTMAAVTTAPSDVCRDHEEDGFSCASYDVHNFCSDTTGFAFVIAHTKCPKHCGFCDGSGWNTASTVVMDSTTMPESTTTAAATDAPTTTVGGASVVIGQSTTYNPPMPSATANTVVCEDKEDANFKCTDHMDLCLDSSIYAVQLAMDRCQKFCGLCPTQSTQAMQSTTASPVTVV